MEIPPCLSSFHSFFLIQDTIVLASPLHSGHGIGSKRSRFGRSKATSSAVKDVFNPEIFALEVANGPVIDNNDLATGEFGTLIPRVLLFLENFNL